MNLVITEGKRKKAARQGILIQRQFSHVLVKILGLIEKATLKRIGIENLEGAVDIRKVEDSVFRGYINLDCFSSTMFSKVEFCLTYHYVTTTKVHECEEPEFHPHGIGCWSDGSGYINTCLEKVTAILGYNNPYRTGIDPESVSHANTVRLFQWENDGQVGLELEEVEVSDSNRVDPILWGGKVPTWVK